MSEPNTIPLPPSVLAKLRALSPRFFGRVTLIYENGSVVRVETVESTLVGVSALGGSSFRKDG